MPRSGHSGFVPGARVGSSRVGSSNVRLLHLVPHAFGVPDLRLGDSARDCASRRQYFQERGIWFDEFYHRTHEDLLANVLSREDLPAYTHILVEGAITSRDWMHLAQGWPNARLIMRSHERERRRAGNVIRPHVAAPHADCILAMEPLTSAARYWARFGLRGEVLEAPCFLTDEYLAEIKTQVGTKGRKRRDWVVYATRPDPSPEAMHGLRSFHRAVRTLGKRRPDWRFLVIGNQLSLDGHQDHSPRVKPLGIVDNPMGVLAMSRAVAVLSVLGRGVTSTILEAIACKTWVLINPELLKRLPEAVTPYCVVADLDSASGLDEALDRIGRKQWPEGDPNIELRARARAALDRALFGDRVSGVVGATLTADVSERRTTAVSWWCGLPEREARIEATFCTVLTPLHGRVLTHNHEIVRRLNEDCTIHWNVVDNHAVHVNDKWTRGFQNELATAGEQCVDRDVDITEYVPGATVYGGLTPDETFEHFAEQLQSTPEEAAEHRRLLTKYLASYHHASGLNLALEHVRTRYAVVIDPDFYVVRPGWLREAIDHMTAHDLAVFGAPWNPRWYQKFRYFPCSHLMIIDLQKYPWREDMLTPDLVRPGVKYISMFWLDFVAAPPEGRWKSSRHLLRHAVQAIREDIRQRTTIEYSRDTGYQMLEEFRSRKELNAGTVVPVCGPGDAFEPATVSAVQRRVDAFLPDRWSYLPRRPGYLSREGFDAHGFPDCRSLGWEEFLWKGAPFAFHVRGELHRRSVGRTDDVQVVNTLNGILRRMGRSPIVDRTVAGRT